MIMDKKPSLILLDDFQKPFSQSRLQLVMMMEDLKSIDKDYIRKGIFVFAVSLFESSLLDYLKVYFSLYPEKIQGGKLEGKDVKFILNTTFTQEVVEIMASDYVSSISQGNVNDIVKKVFDTLGVQQKDIDYNNKLLQEIKERRNIVVHNNARVDKKYIRNTSANPEILGMELRVDLIYLKDAVSVFEMILSFIQNRVEQMFSNYTKESLIRNLWKYYFSILKFDDYCFFQEGDFRFRSIESLKDAKGLLSASQISLLAYFIQNYSPKMCESIFKFGELNMQVSTLQMREMVELFEQHPLLLQNGSTRRSSFTPSR